MAGFLDKNTTVVDMILTAEGRRLLSLGDLDVCYFALFDDEVDYDPHVALSGTMSSVALSSSRDEFIENSLVLEAVAGYRGAGNASGSDFTNVRYPLFSVKQGSRVLPSMTASDGPSGTIVLSVNQQKVREVYSQFDVAGNVTGRVGPFDRGYVRTPAGEEGVTLRLYPAESAPDPRHQNGILVRVFQTGSEGLRPVSPRRDGSNELTYGNDLIFRASQRG